MGTFMYNRLKPVGKYEHPTNPPPTYKKFYSLSFKTFKVSTLTVPNQKATASSVQFTFFDTIKFVERINLYP
ncbi:hypothetical protein COE25_28190 [Bacillus sp. AFS031507]|nr:hypothetical protein COE25_28190 [Bacillus sp. AFS031507]